MTTTVECAADRLRMQEEREPAPDATLTIAEVAERTGVTAHTLRYYERIGLLAVGRDHSGHRVYSADDYGRVVFVNRLRTAGMPIRELQRYIALAEAGDHTVPERLQIMLDHRDAVRTQIQELQFCLETIEFKIAAYGGAMAP
ncbi:MerR family transcriptional regulator [Pseudonocardia sp. GCM10023141]|uniref:MerR family transcriptional regulator n=1 Tax=Pseudonocardia sp. GCM10023141 TaxID=3252653 RepID=UPI003613834D